MDTYETRVKDADGWAGVPFKTPAQMQESARDAGKHDGGPMPPEAPRPQTPQPQEEKK